MHRRETEMKLGVKAYLKSVGFQFDKTPEKLDRMFHTSLDDDGKRAFAHYGAIAPQYKDIKDVLTIHTTAKQAARLFSSDANRYTASMASMDDFLSATPPGSVLDVGCGAGFLIGYLSQKYPLFSFEGLESQPNLAQIASEFTGERIFNLNYLTELPPQTYDYVLCEFGWDASDIAEGGAPHELIELDGHQYCEGCSQAAEKSYAEMLLNWSQLLKPNGKLFVTGRLGTIGDLIAFLSAANKCGLGTTSNGARWIYWKHNDTNQRAPALMLEHETSKGVDEVLAVARSIYKSVKH
jgi:SAM-dependent methyltransferase